MNEKIVRLMEFLTEWLRANVLTWETAAQWGCVVGAYLGALLLWKGFEKRLFRTINDKVSGDLSRQLLRALVDIGNVVGFILIMQVSAAVFTQLGHHTRVLDAASELAVAWIVIRLLTAIMSNRSLARAVAVVVWCIAALSIFGLLAPVTEFLEGLSFSVGETKFTALGAIKGVTLALVFLQCASLAARFAQNRLENARDLTPSLQVLSIKVVKVLLYMAAILLAMSAVGIDLTSLAIFSSALGVGIGFGLKTVFSNYVAGILLLMDNSIKPGDTIEVGQVFGTVKGMHGRYASVLTRDGKEYLIPNELLIANEVINWTYSDSNIRLKLGVGISYGSDVEKAMQLLEQAAEDVPRVLKQPAPAARLMGFGDSSVDLELRFWIADASEGVANVGSPLRLNIWKLFHEHGIEIPFPQRDVLLKPDSKLQVTIDKGETDD